MDKTTDQPGWRRWGVTLTGVTLCLYTLFEVIYLLFPPLAELAIFLMLTLILTFIHIPVRKGRYVAWIDILGILFALVTGVYIVIEHDALMIRIGIPTSVDVAMGIATTLLVLEAARRTVGWILPGMGCLAIVYAALGAYLSETYAGHGGFSLHRIFTDIYLTEQGIYGAPLSIMFRLVVLFIIFGVLLSKTGGTGFLIDLSQSLFSRFAGGPGKVAVVASGLFGTISGSAVANVMVDGWITIPMMKKTGFKAHVAAGVEAAASTGGQLMPPVMGSAAFMMIQFVGTSYFQIIKAAAIPGILYYLALFAAVHFYAVKYGLKGIAPEKAFAVEDLLRRGTVFFLPLVALTVALAYYSPSRAVLLAMAVLLIVSSFRRQSRLKIRTAVESLREAGLDSVSTVCAAASVGIVIAMVMLTGLGLRLPGLIMGIAGNNLLLLLVLVMITSIILGMGLPTVVCYLLLATIMAPALVKFGVPLMAAHLFILYFGCLSMITPPVALAAYAAGAIGGADLMKTGFAAWKLALSGFIVPFMFVYGPPLLLKGTPIEIAQAFVSASLGVIVLGAAIMGYFVTKLRVWEWFALMVASFFLIKVGWITDLLGLGLTMMVFLIQWRRKRSRLEPLEVLKGKEA